MQPSAPGDPSGGGDPQADVIAVLSDPAAYPARPGRIERFETHGALVFLAGDEAWKIKRAVRFPYMDLSTLEKRRALCEREVDINRRLAPELYLGCVPIVRAAGGRLRLGGDGEPVEWAVHMRRFDQAALLSRIAAAQPLAPGVARDLADAVYESHRTAQPAAAAAGAAPLAQILASVTETLASLPEACPAAAVQRLGQRGAHRLQSAAAIIDRRAAAGCVRRCHGDLHLNNIVVWQGRPVLFDALEFDETLATIDTLYDLAFLLMDLDRCGQRAAANAVLTRYLWCSGADLDLEGLQALPLFLGLRAAIRAMVTAERAAQEPGDAGTPARAEATRYLDAALAYLAPASPCLVAIAGLSGTGKSTVAAALAPELGPAPGAVHLRSDLERKVLHGADETTRLAADAYTEAAGRDVYAMLGRKARLVLAAGHGAVVDAVMIAPEQRAAFEEIARGLGLPFRGIWLQATPDHLVGRVAARRGDASDATPDVVRQQLARNTGPLGSAWTRVDASGTAHQTLSSVQQALACTA